MTASFSVEILKFKGTQPDNEMQLRCANECGTK